MKSGFMVAMGALILLTGCASDEKFACGMPEGKTCMPATEVYKRDVLHEKPAGKADEHGGKADKNIRVTDALDRSFKSFGGSVQRREPENMGALALVREPVYRTIYFPAKVAYTRSGRPFEVLPHVIVVEQIPGGFVMGGSPDENARTQMNIPWVGK